MQKCHPWEIKSLVGHARKKSFFLPLNTVGVKFPYCCNALVRDIITRDNIIWELDLTVLFEFCCWCPVSCSLLNPLTSLSVSQLVPSFTGFLVFLSFFLVLFGWASCALRIAWIMYSTRVASRVDPGHDWIVIRSFSILNWASYQLMNLRKEISLINVNKEKRRRLYILLSNVWDQG